MAMQVDRVPAWKRLGLKLKNVSSIQEPALKRRKANTQASGSNKQHRTPPAEHINGQSSNGKNRTESSNGAEADNSRESEIVATSAKVAAAEPFEASESHDVTISKDLRLQRKREAREKRHQPEAEAEASQGQMDGSRSYIAYLQQFHRDRSNWKFNKSLQTNLLRDCLNLYRVPPELDQALLEYVGGLQGQGARIRLAEEAKKIIEEPLSQSLQLPTSDDMRYPKAPAGLSTSDAEKWNLHMDNKKKFYEQWNASNTIDALEPEVVAKKKDFEEFMARLRKTGAAEDGLREEHRYNELRRRRAQQILAAVSILMNAMIVEERQKRDQVLAAAGKPSKPQNDDFAPKIVNRGKRSRGRKRRTAAASSSSSSSSSSSDSSSSSESSDSDDS